MTRKIVLDKKDRRILAALDTNARQSNTAIAKAIGLNKNTVTYKIKRLSDAGIIQRYYTVIDSARLGYFSMRIYLKFFRTSSDDEDRIIEWLKAQDLVGVVGRIEMTYDLVFMVWVKSIHEFKAFWNGFKGCFRKYVWQERVHIFSGVLHCERAYLDPDRNGQKRNVQEIGGELAPHDTTDLAILSLLADNARTPLVMIAEKLQIPARTIAARIKALERKKIIQGYRVHLNLDALGYVYYKINITLDDFSAHDTLMEYSKEHEYVIYIDETLAEIDFEVDVEVPRKEGLSAFLTEVKKSFPIRHVEVLAYDDYLKLKSIPVFDPIGK